MKTTELAWPCQCTVKLLKVIGHAKRRRTHRHDYARPSPARPSRVPRASFCFGLAPWHGRWAALWVAEHRAPAGPVSPLSAIRSHTERTVVAVMVKRTAELVCLSVDLAFLRPVSWPQLWNGNDGGIYFQGSWRGPALVCREPCRERGLAAIAPSLGRYLLGSF